MKEIEKLDTEIQLLIDEGTGATRQILIYYEKLNRCGSPVRSPGTPSPGFFQWDEHPNSTPWSPQPTDLLLRIATRFSISFVRHTSGAIHRLSKLCQHFSQLRVIAMNRLSDISLPCFLPYGRIYCVVQNKLLARAKIL